MWQESIFSKYSAGMGNTPSVSCSRTTPAKERPPRSVNDMDLWFSGSAHGVPIELPCLRWQSKATREPNSPRHSRHLNPSDIGTCALPSGFPRPAPRRMLWNLKFNLHQFSARDSDAQYSPWSNTETKHNTKRLRTTPCMVTYGSVAWFCTHRGWQWLHHMILNENQNDQNVRSSDSQQIRRISENYTLENKTRSVYSPNMQCTLSLNNVHKAHNVTAEIYWVNFDNLNTRAGQRLVRHRHVDEEPADEEAFPASVEWNMVSLQLCIRK